MAFLRLWQLNFYIWNKCYSLSFTFSTIINRVGMLVRILEKFFAQFWTMTHSTDYILHCVSEQTYSPISKSKLHKQYLFLLCSTHWCSPSSLPPFHSCVWCVKSTTYNLLILFKNTILEWLGLRGNLNQTSQFTNKEAKMSPRTSISNSQPSMNIFAAKPIYQ